MRKLVITQEPARNWYIVHDEDDEEQGCLYGPTPHFKECEAFKEGYLLHWHLGDDDDDAPNEDCYLGLG